MLKLTLRSNIYVCNITNAFLSKLLLHKLLLPFSYDELIRNFSIFNLLIFGWFLPNSYCFGGGLPLK